MSIGTLWVTEAMPQGKYIRSAAAYAGLKIDLPEAYTHFEDNKKPEFLAKFPHGKIPAFESKDGFTLVESIAIARYVASLAPNSTLLGSTVQEAALVDQWVSFALSEIASPLYPIVGMLRGMIQPYNKAIHTEFASRQLRALKTLEGQLASRTFLVGERLSLADFAIAAAIQFSLTVTIGSELRSELSNIIRHFETVVNQPSVKEIYGETQYIEKPLEYVAPPKEKKEQPKEKKEQPKQEKKPKKKDDDDDDDDKPIEEPKPKNPLDSLPKSTFNLEDWKRAYSNLDTRGPGGSIEWFYQHFDKEGFSLWRVDFNYPEDLTQVFMSSNLIGGFFNRLEASRKYLFGSMGVLGSSNNSLISGTFIARGQEHQPVFEVAPDWESYGFKKLDIDNEEDKKFFEAALAWDLEIDGKAWADGKNFK